MTAHAHGLRAASIALSRNGRAEDVVAAYLESSGLERRLHEAETAAAALTRACLTASAQLSGSKETARLLRGIIVDLEA